MKNQQKKIQKDSSHINEYFTITPNIYTPYTSQAIYLKPKENVYNIDYNEKEQSFNINNGELFFKKGDKVYIVYKYVEDDLSYKTYLIINNISYVKDTSIFIMEAPINDATIFLTPLLNIGFNNKNVSENINSFIYNTYVEFDKNNEPIYCYLKMRFFPFSSYIHMENIMKNNKNFHSILLEEDERFRTYKYNISIIIKEDMQKIINGLYHKISIDSKQKIIKFNDIGEHDYFYKVLYNDENLRKQLYENLGVDYQDYPDLGLRSKPNLKDILWKKNKNNI